MLAQQKTVKQTVSDEHLQEPFSAPKLACSMKKSIEKVNKHARKIWAATKSKRGLSPSQVQKMQRTAARIFAPSGSASIAASSAGGTDA